MLFKDPALKYLAQKAFVTYTKSVYLQKDKDTFKLKEYDLEAFAASLGLPGAPRIKFLKDDDSKKRKHVSRQELEVSDSSEGEDDVKADEKPKTVRTKYDRMFERQNQDILADHYQKLVKNDDVEGVTPAANGAVQAPAADDDDDFLSVKRRIPAGFAFSDDEAEDAEGDIADTTRPDHKVVHLEGASQPLIIDSNRREKLLKSKKKLLKLKDKGTKLVFDDEGNPHEIYELEDEADFKAKGLPQDQRQKYLEAAREVVQQADVEDKAAARAKRKEKMRKRKEKERAGAQGGVDAGTEDDDEEEGGGVQYVVGDNGEDPLANFRADMGGSDDDAEEEEEEEPKQKKPKKWFQSDSEDEEDGKRRGKKRKSKGGKNARHADVQEPETLEDMEARAAGLLG
jgi:ATP-dependent RNA helicase DDX10/DBP4